MIHSQTLERYFKIAIDDSNPQASLKAQNKLLEYFSDSRVFSWSRSIDLLREGLKLKTRRSQFLNLSQELQKNKFFQSEGTQAQKQELNGLLGEKQHTVQSKKGTHTREFVYREDTTRVETPTGRKYVLKSGEEFTWAGVTSIWSAVKPFDRSVWIRSLQRKHPDWDDNTIYEFMEKTRNDAANRGTAMHEAIEKYLQSKETFSIESDCQTCGQPYLKNIMPLLRYEIDEVIAIEPLVWWDLTEELNHPQAGAIGYVDLIGTHDGKVVLYDWKTADKRKNRQYIDNYYVQVSAYCAMAYQTYGIKIDEARIAIAIAGAKSPQVFVLDRQTIKNHLLIFLSNVKEYCKMLDNYNEDSTTLT